MLHVGETAFFDPSEYVASHENCADCPDVSDVTPKMAMEESVVAGGGADLVYALQQKLADPSICVKSNHDDPLELKNVCPADAVASLE